MAAAKSSWHGNSNIVFSIASYWACSIGLVFLNKHLLSGAGATVDLPLFITWFQCFVTVAICSVLSWGTAFVNLQFPKLDLKLDACRKVLPLSVVFVAMISFNNVCLKYVGVSFYYIGRSLTTVFNVVLTYTMLGERSSVQTVSACILIVFGFLLGVDQENMHNSNFTLGVIFGVLASFAVALNAIHTKQTLPKVDNCIWKLTWYNNINALILFLPIILLNGDFSQMIDASPGAEFWRMLFISGLFGFTMNYVTGWQIQATSPLTHNISATAKSAAQTLIAVFLYDEVKTMLWWSSNLIVLIGSALYTWIRNAEMKKKIKMK